MEQMTGQRPPSPVLEIGRDQLRERLARGDRLKLVMASSDWAFDAKHLPGSVHFTSQQRMLAGLGRDEEIVVYCSNIDCRASLNVIKKLLEHGYTRVSHYPGGLLEWEAAGLPVEGEWAEQSTSSAR
jgi:rhodanese-related sulfurtransferase